MFSLIISCGSAMAESIYDTTGSFAGVYFCEGEATGGVVYDKKVTRWTGASGEAKRRKIVKITSGSIIEEELGPEFNRIDYNIFVGDHGAAHSFHCQSVPGYFIRSDGVVLCQANDDIYKLDLKKLVFMEFHIAEFFSGGEQEEFSKVTAGRCTKIE